MRLSPDGLRCQKSAFLTLLSASAAAVPGEAQEKTFGVQFGKPCAGRALFALLPCLLCFAVPRHGELALLCPLSTLCCVPKKIHSAATVDIAWILVRVLTVLCTLRHVVAFHAHFCSKYQTLLQQVSEHVTIVDASHPAATLPEVPAAVLPTCCTPCMVHNSRDLLL